MLISEPLIGSFRRFFIGKAFLFFCCWMSCYKPSDLCTVRVRDRRVSVVQYFLHSLNRELKLKPGNPTKHVSIPAVQVLELLETIKEHIGCTLHEERPLETLEVLHSVVRVFQPVSIQKPFFHRCFTFQSISQSWSTLVAV